jgi:hypothetical protein
MMLPIKKLAFIHIVRTGGTSILGMFSASPKYDVFDSWAQYLKRDWTSKEIIEFVKNDYKRNVLIHNHVVSWTHDQIEKLRLHKWHTFTIVRNPIHQLMSIYNRFINTEITLESFIEKQINGEYCEGWNYQHWAIPSYWQEIDTIIMYQPSLVEKLNIFGIYENELFCNKSKKTTPMPENLANKIRRTEFFETFCDVEKHCMNSKQCDGGLIKHARQPAFE